MAEATFRRCDKLARLSLLAEQRAIAMAEADRLWAEAASAKRDVQLIDRRMEALAREP